MVDDGLLMAGNEQWTMYMEHDLRDVDNVLSLDIRRARPWFDKGTV